MIKYKQVCFEQQKRCFGKPSRANKDANNKGDPAFTLSTKGNIHNKKETNNRYLELYFFIEEQKHNWLK